jgi:putative methylase
MALRQRDLEIALQRLRPFEAPDAALEQYSTPAPIAADLLYTAHALGDIEGRAVADLGCGPGTLGIGAALLGAETVIGIDVDEKAIALARSNCAAAGVEMELSVMDVSAFSAKVDTVVMNPPFGAQTRHADTPFLLTAMRCAERIYSLHNAGTERYLEELAQRSGFGIFYRRSYKFELKHQFAFHRKAKKEIEVALLCFQRDGDKR